MTKHDSAALADFIALLQNEYFKGRLDADEVLPELARLFAEEMKIRNPKFDSHYFLDRCCI